MRRVWAIVVLVLVAATVAPSVTAADRGADCQGRRPTIRGTEGDDRIVGTSRSDVIAGYGGSDEIIALGGDDVVCGGSGADRIVGGDGDDELRGQGGDDTLVGGVGDDALFGGDGDDDLAGKDGEDQMRGGRDDDVMRGGPGDDALHGRAGDDLLIGGPGEDTLRGNRGVDRCNGESERCEEVRLDPGDGGAAVERLQAALAAAGLYRRPVDGRFDDETTAAVVAFHKLSGEPAGNTWSTVDHVGTSWSLYDWDLLDRFQPVPPKRRAAYPDRVEVDIGHQVLYLIEGQEVAAILPVSTGGEYWYGNQQYAHTPRGHHEFYRYVPGWQSNGQYESWYFKSIFAVHGYRLVPLYPASHGCVRVHLWDADWLKSRLELGMSIFVWDD